MPDSRLPLRRFPAPTAGGVRTGIAEYGRHVPASDQYFVMHRVPPRGVTDDAGKLVEITPSAISFTLCDDVRDRIERGEEI